MSDFEAYLDTCDEYWQQAQQKLSSQPNPAQLAGVASNLYYCLNHIGDGIKELKWFTMNYNDQYLHTGQEIFRIAHKMHSQAQERAVSCNLNHKVGIVESLNGIVKTLKVSKFVN